MGILQPTRKFIETITSTDDWEILTDTGYESIETSNKTIPYDVWKIETSNHELECADDHIVFLNDGKEIFAKDLQIDDIIQTESGDEKIISVNSLGFEETMYDLQLPKGTNHRYYTNGILSHNTTVLLELLSKLHSTGKKVLFISAEMNKIDMSRYLQRFPQWGQIPIMFLSDHSDSCPKTAIESVLNKGWDLVLTDSYTEVNDTVKEECNMTRGKTEKWFLSLMNQHNLGLNKKKTYTSFITILQMSKGGTFVGSNKLKHMTSAMMKLDWEGDGPGSKRYMEFSKNRVGEVGKKLYFDLNGGVSFNEARYARDLFNDEILDDERNSLNEEAASFDRLFGFDKNDNLEDLKTAADNTIII
jgi:hypothetical protein